MSHAVPLTALADELARRPYAYLLTVADDGRPHAVAIMPRWDGADLHISGAGRRTRANAGARPDVSLVWPAADHTGFSLIADGTARADGDLLAVHLDHAVLHRPAAGTCET